jgi:hypothetical protein
MAQPDSILNTRGQSTDTLYGADGVARTKLGVGIKDVGLTPDATWHGVATHMDGDDFETSDGVIVMGGVITATSKAKALAVSDAGGLTLTIVPSAGNLTDRSGTIATGSTSQQLAASNIARKYLLVQNLDSAADLWINFTADAVQDQPSVRISPGDAFIMEGSFVSTQQVNVIGPTTGQKFTAKEG